MVICNHCGNIVEDGLRFCSECGTDTAPAATQAYPERPPGIGSAANTLGFGEANSQQDLYATKPMVENTARTFTNDVNRPIPTSGSPNQSANNLRLVVIAFAATFFVLAIGGLLVWWTANKDSITDQSATTVNDPRSNNPTSSSQRSAPSATKQPATPAPAAAFAEKDGAMHALNSWVNALNSYDLNLHMSYFTDTLDIYHARRNVSSNKVRADLARAFARYSRLNVEISNVAITLDSSNETATATFNKSWRFESDSAKQWSGSVRQMVWLKKFGERWLIAGLKDF
jgi:hypothetical protein